MVTKKTEPNQALLRFAAPLDVQTGLMENYYGCFASALPGCPILEVA